MLLQQKTKSLIFHRHKLFLAHREYLMQEEEPCGSWLIYSRACSFVRHEQKNFLEKEIVIYWQ
jgi:hypothetical protein